MRSLFWLCVGFSSVFLLYTFLSSQTLPFDIDYSSEIVPASLAVDEVALFSTCVLAEFAKDGWTKDVIEKTQVDWDPVRKCDEKFMPFTVLGENGTVWLNDKKDGMENVKCSARAIYFKDEWHFNASEWVALGRAPSNVVFTSDFVHTTCHKINNVSEIVDDFVHLQMGNAKDDGGRKMTAKSPPRRSSAKFPTPKLKQEEVEIDEKPSVFIFVLDSVANSQALRALPKTVSLLRHEFDAVNLRHVNKVGENSNPNGIAFLIGKMITDMDRGIFGMSSEKADWNETYACHRYFDDEPFILKEFTKKGYKSLMAEDWLNGVFTYPNCWGFKNAPVTHYMRPFQVYYDSNSKQSKKLMGEDQCLETHTFLFNYLNKFMNAYKESPKISLVWAVGVAHDHSDLLYHIDEQLFNYFKNHRKILDKSYVFVMGDHGKRWGPVRDTFIGVRETDNPVMFVSVPRHLREKVNPVLKENSNALLTHFDTHASLVDILNEPHLEAQEGPRGLRGTSFFRPLPPGERSCRTLPIPIQYCLCERNKTKSEDEEVNAEIGRGAVNLLNARMRDIQISDSCEEFTFKAAKEVEMIDRTDGLTEILFDVLECEAQFKTIVRVSRMRNGEMNVTLAANDFTRTNSYGDTASCMSNRASLRPLCCCRDRPGQPAKQRTTNKRSTTEGSLRTTSTRSTKATKSLFSITNLLNLLNLHPSRSNEKN